MPISSEKQYDYQLIVGFILALIILAIGSFSASLQRLDFYWLDPLVRWQSKANPPPDDIVLIDIDNYSLEAMAPEVGNWPWPRATHAYLVEWLNEQGAKAIVFDIWFSEASLYLAEMDDYFAETLAKHNNVYMPTLLMDGNAETIASMHEKMAHTAFIRPTSQAIKEAHAALLWPAIANPEHWRLGLVNFLPESDGVGRQYPVYMEKDGWRFLSLPALLVNDSGATLPDTPAIRVKWQGATPPYTTHAYRDIFNKLSAGETDAGFKNKYVFIGSTASGNHDLKPTPLGSQFPAVYMMMNAFDNLRTQQHLTWSPWFAFIIGTLALITILWILLSQRPYRQVFITALGVLTGVFAASYWGVKNDLLLPVISPLIFSFLFLLVAAVIRYLQAKEAEGAAVEIFGRFMDPNVVKTLISEGLTESTQQAQEREITVLFSDIRGFTTLSEKQTAREIMNLLNHYFEQQVGVIFEHEGTLDKFIGDAIMAFWGAPLDDPRHAEKAVKAALSMAEKLETFCKEHQLEGFDIGIGLHTGNAVVGMLGAAKRMDYTAIGDTVNLASRLEGLTKGIARILVSESTMLACKDCFDFTPHGAYKVKGREQEVQVFEPRSKHP